MEILFIVLIFILLVLPPFFTMRKQRQRQNEMVSLQNSLVPGQEVVTAGGVHGVVAATREAEIDLEVGNGVVITFEKMAIVRSKEQAQAEAARLQQQAKKQQGGQQAQPQAHPEQAHPEQQPNADQVRPEEGALPEQEIRPEDFQNDPKRRPEAE